MDKNKIYQNISLKKFNSWKVGGNAEYFLICSDVKILSRLLKLEKIKLPITFIGLGSNLLIRDGGVQGTVIGVYGGLNEIRKEKDLIFVEAGVSCSKLSKFSAREGFSESAFLSGIPGTVGGALAMNAGCYGAETWDYVQKVMMINSGGDITIKQKYNFDVSYREVSNGNKEENFIAAWFKFPEGNMATSEAAIKKLLIHRRDTQPLNQPTAGSTFRNPNNDYAARLIEECGLKGFKKGMAQVSEKHANFIVNLGNATASDIEFVINHIQKVVQEKKSIHLIREIKIIGESVE